MKEKVRRCMGGGKREDRLESTGTTRKPTHAADGFKIVKELPRVRVESTKKKETRDGGQ